MADVSPIKLKDVGGGAGQLSEFEPGDKVPLDHLTVALGVLGGLLPAADKLPYFTGTNAGALAPLTEFGRSLLDDLDAAAALNTLGLGTPSTLGKSLLAAADVASAQALLRLAFAKSGAWYGDATNPTKIPIIEGNGILDVGKYIDFHETSGDTTDYVGRLFSNNGLPLWATSADNVARVVFTQHNIVGALGYVGNYPSGAIFEQGRNANGVYTRFADGTQICRAVFDQNIAFGNPYGPGYYGIFGWDYPAAFANTLPSVTYACKPQGGLAVSAGGNDPGDGNVSRCTILPLAFVNTTFYTRISLMAIGTWR